MTCSTPNCDRAVPFAGHRFCDDCFAVVLRTGRPPELPVKFVPRWLARQENPEAEGNTMNRLARDETGHAA